MNEQKADSLIVNGDHIDCPENERDEYLDKKAKKTKRKGES